MDKSRFLVWQRRPGREGVFRHVPLADDTRLYPTGVDATKLSEILEIYPISALEDQLRLVLEACGGIEEVYHHSKTLHNEIHALRDRVLRKVPMPSLSAQKRMQQSVTKLGTWLTSFEVLGRSVLPWSLSKASSYLESKHGLNYKRARESFAVEPLSSKDSHIKMFIKKDKWTLADGQGVKSPRAIQYRGPRFNIVACQYFGPIEETLMQNERDEKYKPGTRFRTTKGLTSYEKGRLISSVWDSFKCPAAIHLDHSKFDAHETEFAIRMEHEIYRMIYTKDGRRKLGWIRKSQISNRGRGSFGTKYKMKGRRVSGDVNTSLGNSIVNWLAMDSVVPEGVVIIVEGDDTILIGERYIIDALYKTLYHDLLEAGFEVEHHIAYCLEDIEYCSARMIEMMPGIYTLMRKPHQAIPKDCYTINVIPPQKVPERKRAMALSAMYSYAGHPIMYEWARCMMSWSESGCLTRFAFDDEHIKQKVALSRDVDLFEVPDLARDSFYVLSDIPPSRQIEMERQLRALRGPHSVMPTKAEVSAWQAISRSIKSNH